VTVFGNLREALHPGGHFRAGAAGPARLARVLLSFLRETHDAHTRRRERGRSTMARRTATSWSMRDTMFALLIMLFAILSAMAGIAAAAYDGAPLRPDGGAAGSAVACAGAGTPGPGQRVEAAPSDPPSGKAITGSIGTPFPTGCR
jgi:hypothetical protein